MKLGTIAGTKKPLALDVDALIATRLLVTATSGGGKSFAMRRILEQTHGKVQQIVLDPEGEFPSLRAKFDFVLAGKGGDLAARPESAARLAHVLLEIGMSAVLDLYELKAPERQRFTRLFLEAMINAPKRLWHPVLVAIDEVHTYCPERGQAEAAEAVIDLCTRGRKRGFSAFLATQRVSNLNKQAAATCTNMMVGLTFQDVDRRRAVEMLGAESRTAERELRTGLMRLKPGDFWCLGRAFSEQARTLIRVGPVRTRHPQIAGGRKAMPGPPPPSRKVKEILATIEDIPREAEEEADELAKLRRRVRELQAEVRERPVEKVGLSEQEWAERERQWRAVYDDIRERCESLVEATSELNEGQCLLGPMLEQLKEADAKLEAATKRFGLWASPIPEPPGAPKSPGARPRSRAAPPRPAQPAVVADTDYRPRAGARRMLVVLAGYHLGSMTVAQVRTMARLRKSGTSDTYLSELVRHGLIERDGNEVRITEAGVAHLGGAVKGPMTAAETLEQWRAVFRAGERRMLDALVADEGRGMTREQLGAESGLEPSSGTFGTYLGVLRRNGLATESGGLVRLADFLLEAA